MDTRTGLPIVGMVGGGQLARMTHQAAIALGQSLRVLAVGEGESAGLVAADVTHGHHTDLDALRTFARGVDVLTFDHEHVPGEHLRALADEGVVVRPGPGALAHAQNKLLMRERMASLGLPNPAFVEVKQVSDAVKFGDDHGWPAILKAATGGYDGKGVWQLDSADEARAQIPELLDAGMSLLIEERVPMARELSALVARSPFGQGAAWPVVETVQSDGINTEVLAPAPGLSEAGTQRAQGLALRIAEQLDVAGVMAVELFETHEGGLVINELAMRPHNSGHWTMDGSRTSQFEQHMRAVLDYPLGTTDLLSPTVMANVLGAPETPTMSVDERLHHLYARYPDVKVHLYGKSERPGRKLGHVNVGGPIDESTRAKARVAAHWLSAAEWPDGYSIH
ncbi:MULTISPECIES: 5-(carboxyamino)imidazole ribonucleotide synthase [Prauserella salsuginis group]|uniref:N5-carboxyaminoimidazole ribonucleotide synthase n=1 Tax=Prauserella salsuginis TaxID=387889 RepID=A0ABW6G6T0_9PSEU|nr:MULTISPECIES: 5-(carboxyamino)imidazole ribonucleotide synthase [Prauserella salsuginis group]MCR3722707.1 5-(carboxyamino)imidazole ribonucleotide synthase [Prauserella flava]MCR3737238.1 5-(carboxyamino)imidazole ribonucleotide synthase [Prauserella salsuginis]